MPRKKPGLSSKLLLRPNMFWFEETQSIIKVTNQTPQGFSHALKMHFARKKLTPKVQPNPKLECVFCKRPNNTWFFKTNVIGKHLTVTAIEYHNPIHFCFLPGKCRGKKLNPNSKEFVAATRKVSEEEAVAIIHSRNTSPFYKENHSSLESYKKYQGTRITANKSSEEIQKILNKQNYSRSLEGYISRFGKEQGTERWKKIQSLKGITLNNLKRKHGDKAEIVLAEWKSKICQSLNTFKARYGDEEGLKKYRDYLQKVIAHRTNAFGVISVEDGHVLRSNYERTFFNLLKEAGISTSQFLTDGYYPDSVSRYDFYFPDINLYVEIAGLKNEKYEEKLEMKRKQFNPIIIRPNQFKSGEVHDVIEIIKKSIKKGI
jgi:hypothetical protein